MLEDLVKGVRDYVTDRFLSPLGASLTVSWCLWNYKFWIIVLSGESAIRKIHLIHLVYQDQFYSWTHLLVGPVATALFYIYVFPHPSKWAYSYSLARRKDSLEVLRSVEGQTVLTKEESQALRKRFVEMDLRHTEESVGLTSTIDSLKDQLKLVVEERELLALELSRERILRVEADELASLKTSPASSDSITVEVSAQPRGEGNYLADPLHVDEARLSKSSLSKVQLSFVITVGKYGSNMQISDISARLGIGDAATKHVAGQLQEMNMVYVDSARSLEGDFHMVASLTDAGLRIFMETLE